ncbi:hypothetical protein M758_11G120100 [Ceratodon purpureus]|nr:hypothetical protein M758_11G120100 [Ceratodon purpureus]
MELYWRRKSRWRMEHREVQKEEALNVDLPDKMDQVLFGCSENSSRPGQGRLMGSSFSLGITRDACNSWCHIFGTGHPRL